MVRKSCSNAFTQHYSHMMRALILQELSQCLQKSIRTRKKALQGQESSSQTTSITQDVLADSYELCRVSGAIVDSWRSANECLSLRTLEANFPGTFEQYRTRNAGYQLTNACLFTP